MGALAQALALLIKSPQILVLLVQLFPSALKAVQAWQEYHDAKLNRECRRQLASDVTNAVKAAVRSKDTAGLEDVIKNLGKPPVIPTQPDVDPGT